MKTIFYILFVLAFSANMNHVVAQCSFTPTIIPSQPILCPESSDTLATQTYDSYQWYKGNNPISGATNQFYAVTENDVLDEFKVAATLNGCTELSDEVLVDGYVFLFPFVIHSGDMGTFDPDTYTTILCTGDTLILELGSPYSENIQWYDAGAEIPGANNKIFYVTESGSYHVCGAPEVCPDYIQCLGVTIDVQFVNPIPEITLANDELISTESASYQWYLNGDAISGASDQTYIPLVSGSYTVMTINEYGCAGISEPFEYFATGVVAFSNNMFYISSSSQEKVSITFHQPFTGTITLYDLSGRALMEKNTDNKIHINLDVSQLLAGIFFIEIEGSGRISVAKYIKN